MFCLSNSRAIPRGRVRRDRLRRRRARQACTRQDQEGQGTAAEVHVTLDMGQPGLYRGHQAIKIRRKSRLHLTDNLSISSTVSWLSISNTVPGYPTSSQSDDTSDKGFKLHYDINAGDRITRKINAVGASNNVSSLGAVLCSSSTSPQCRVDPQAGHTGCVADDDIEDSYHYDNDGNLVTNSGARYNYNVATRKENNPSADFSISSNSSSYFNTDVNDMPAITHFVLEGSPLIKPNRPNKSSQCKRSSAIENLEYEPNPEVVPFQPANFIRHHSVLPLPVVRSSTILKRVPIPKRHQDTFGGYEYNFVGKRGVMLHTDRYQIDFIKSLDGMTQRERLQAGFDYMEAMRGTRRRREMVPHRAQLDLIMGGKQIEFEERFDINREIQKLKSIAMPKHAKDLFHGRGIHLPQHHLSLHPRFQAPVEDDELLIPSQSTMPSIPRRSQVPPSSAATNSDLPVMDTNFQINGGQSMLFRVNNGLKKHKPLPTIRGKTDAGSNGGDKLRGGWRGRLRVSSEPISLARERHEVNRLSARLGLTPRINRDVTSLTKSTLQAPTPSRDRTWQADQKLIAKGLSDKTMPDKLAATKLSMAPPHSSTTENVEKAGHPVTLPTPGGSAAAETVAAEALSQPALSETRGATPLRLPTADPDVTRADPSSRDSKTRPRTEEGGSASVTPHPLRATALITSVPIEEQDALRQTFQRLDTDADGHLKYNQLKTQLPKKFTREQERFTEEVYNLTNSITFFGVDEFMVMNRLSQCVESLTGKAAEAFESLDFSILAQQLLKYIGLFDAMDKGNCGKISLDSLQQILSDTVSPTLITDSALWDEALDSISADFSSEVSKVVFIAHIPLFLSLETAFK